MKIRNLGLLVVVLGAAPTVVFAQPSFEVDIHANVSLPGEPVASVDVFYDQLSPYGVWVDDADLGRVFIPEQAQYVPYTNGHWEYTDIGFVWVSAEPFAWATSHYGRWAYSNAYYRWAWLPDTQWGPAWVEWRETGDYFGWAPLAPDVGYQPPIEAWHYCPAARITDVNIVNYYVPRERVVTIHREARPIEARATIANHRVIVGPPAAKLREHRIAVKATPVNRVDARSVGVLKAPEARAAEARARERKQVVEEQNRKRIEANAALRDVQQRAAVKRTDADRTRLNQQPRTDRQPPAAQPPRQQPDQPRTDRERQMQDRQQQRDERTRPGLPDQPRTDRDRQQQERERQNLQQQQQQRERVQQHQQRERQNLRQQQQREQQERERQNLQQQQQQREQQQRERQGTQQQQRERQDRPPTPQRPAQPPRAVQPPQQTPAPRPNEPKQERNDARPQPKQQPRDARPQPKQQPEKQATPDEPRDHRR